MIPILFEADATDFTTNGIGALLDATKCKVTENRNGSYELTLSYRTSGQYYKELECERLILVKTSEATTRDTWQAFSIYNITDNLDGTVEILAEHISYRANYVPIKPFGIVTGLTAALNKLNTSYFPTETPAIDYPYPFVVDSDIVNETTQYELNTPKSLRNCLGGEEGSLLDRFASRGTGEYLWDNYNIHFLNHRGSDKGYTIRYGKNLSEFSRETDTSEIATGCIAYYTYPDDEEYGPLAGVTIYSGIHYSDLIEIYPVVKTITVDATPDFQDPPNPSQLETYAQGYVDELAYINETTEIDFYDPDNDVKLCDIVHVDYLVYSGSKLVKSINYEAKVIATEWDVLKERYTKITIGENKSDLASTLEEKSQEATAAALQAVDNRIVTVYQHVDEELGEIVDAVAELREDVFDEDEGLVHTINQQGTAIQQNTEQIALKTSSQYIGTLMSDFANLSPYYGHPFDDVHGSASEGRGYWYSSPTRAVPIGEAWANLTFTVPSTASNIESYVYPYFNPNITAENLTILIEITDLNSSIGEFGSLYFITPTTSSGTTRRPQYGYTGSSIQIEEDGIYRLPLTPTGLSDPNMLTRSYFRVYSLSEDYTLTFKVRLSLYRGEYLGAYIPYIQDYPDITSDMSVANQRISELSASLAIEHDRITSQVTETQRLDTAITNLSDSTTAALESQAITYQTLINQTSQEINTIISEVAESTQANSDAIDKYERFLTITQNMDGITIGKSDSDIRGKFDNDSLDFINQNDETLAWLSAPDGLGANMLSVGSSTTKSQRWNIITSTNGNTLRFTRHQ